MNVERQRRGTGRLSLVEIKHLLGMLAIRDIRLRGLGPARGGGLCSGLGRSAGFGASARDSASASPRVTQIERIFKVLIMI